MEWINERLLNLIRDIESEQKTHLKHIVYDQMLDAVIETSTFNNPYVDATRNIKQILRNASSEIVETIKHYNT